MATATLETLAPQPNLPPTAPSAARRYLLDAARLLAAYAIVWLHTPRSAQNWTALGRFAVPFFTAAAVLLVWEGLVRNPNRGLAEYARGRVLRIYVPFLAWSLIYLAFKAVKAVLLPGQPNDFPGLDFLWLGSFYHLWFMPFILLTTLAVFCVGKLAVRRPLAEIGLLVGCVLGGWALAWLPADRSGESASFGLLAIDALPSALWGLALAIACGKGAAKLLRRPWVGIAGLLLAAIGTAVVWHLSRNRLAENLAGLGVLVFALGPWQLPGVQRIAKLGGLAYGIYLSHLLLIKTAQALETRFGIAETFSSDVAVFAVAAVGSTLIAWCLSRSPRTRWLVG